ncbi:hypothetical protein E2C01_019267 [Portunus trituberculatus]|uniref:Uncharacterized protein n=1 Tax=Portunus trituberculatus TaxID=210409 RepID=A0A5B7DYY3_PORTR|nr:hypothetical protein [Portunus trituberculatus]
MTRFHIHSGYYIGGGANQSTHSPKVTAKPVYLRTHTLTDSRKTLFFPNWRPLFKTRIIN